jgi:hypothetical protein
LQAVKKQKRKNTSSTEEQPSTSKNKKLKKEKPVKPEWTLGTFSPEAIRLHQPAYIIQDCNDWDDEKYVSQYFDDEFLSTIVEKSNQSFFQRKGKLLNLTLKELKTWLGINFVMATIQMPKIRMFWEKQWRVSVIADAMVRDRFFQLRTNIKVVYDDDITKEQRNNDRLWKVRPLIDRVQQGCLKQNRNQELCVDEMMVPFTGTCNLKQYIPNKPNPLGIKIFVLANPNGIICDFIVYQGGNTFHTDLTKEFWQCECAVLELSQTLVPGHVLYIDRYFTTVRLADELLKRGIRCSGTLMKSRIPPEANIPDDKAFKRSERRGSSVVSVRPDGRVGITKWLDNNPVAMLSTNESVEPLCTVERWSKKDKKYLNISQPRVIHSYNQKMGGVDLADRMLSYCPCRARTKKWTHRFIMHLFDLCITNAWLQMRQVKQEMGTPARKIPQFRTFKMEYGKLLIEKNSAHSLLQSTEVDDGDEEPAEEIQFLDRRKSVDPTVEKRTQGALHIPDVTKNCQKRCALPKCTMKSTVYCTYCKVYLCLVDGRNCYMKFHSK